MVSLPFFGNRCSGHFDEINENVYETNFRVINNL